MGANEIYGIQRENADLAVLLRSIMLLIIKRIQLATIVRSSITAMLGMSLAEGKALLAAARSIWSVASAKVSPWRTPIVITVMQGWASRVGINARL